MSCVYQYMCVFSCDLPAVNLYLELVIVVLLID